MSFSDWNEFVDPDVPPEVGAARRAVELAEQLTSLRAWTSEPLATHRLRLDPDREAGQIRVAAREIYDLRRTLEATTWPENRSTPEINSARSDGEEQLATSWSALSDRLSAFERYTHDVVEVAIELDRLDSAQRLVRTLAEKAPILTVRAVGNEMAAAELDSLRLELGSLGSARPVASLGQEAEPEPFDVTTWASVNAT